MGPEFLYRQPLNFTGRVKKSNSWRKSLYDMWMELAKEVPPEPEKTHTVEEVKPEPVKVTVVEPRRLPLVGEMEVTTEEGTTWY